MRLYDKEGISRFHDIAHLHHLIRLCDLNMVRDLLSQGVPVNSVRPYAPVSLLFTACVSGHLGMVKLLVEEFGADVDVVQTEESVTVAGYLVKLTGKREIHVRILEYLLRKGTDVNAEDGAGCSLLHRAGDKRTVDVLLRYRADPRRRDFLGKDAFTCTRTPKSSYLGDYIHWKVRQRSRYLLLQLRLQISHVFFV